MSDASTTFVIGVDASKGKSALADFAKSVDRVGDSINKLGASGSGFERLGQQIRAASSGFEALKSIVGIGSATKDIAALSRTLGSFRGPDARAVSGVTQLAQALRALTGVSVPRGLGTNLSVLTKGLADLRVPPMADINRLPAIFAALSRVSNTSVNARTGAEIKYLADGLKALGSIPVSGLQKLPATFAALSKLTFDADKVRGLAGLGEGLKGISGFKSPSAGSISNLQRLISTLQAADPGKLARVATALHGVTIPAVNIRNLSGGGGSMVPTPHAPVSGVNTINTTSITNASAGLNHLQQSFSAVHAAAAAFAGYLGGLSLSSFTHSVLEAGNALTSLKISTDTLASSSTEAGDALKFVEALADRSGARLDTLITGYQRLGGAMRSLGMPVKDVQTTFEGFTSALQAQHIPASEQAIVMREIAEVASMGAAHARQIQSISMHVPDFRSTLMQVTGKKEGDFKKQLADGGFSVEDIIKSAEVLKTRYAGALAEARTHSQAQLNLMSNDWTRFKQAVYEGGLDVGIATMIGSIREKLGDGKIGDFAKSLGESFKAASVEIGALAAVVGNHIEGFTRLGLAIAGVTAASLALSAIGFIAAPLAAAASAASRLGLALLTLETPIAVPLLAAGGALAVLVASSDSADDAISKLSRTWDALKAGMGDFAAGISPIVSATFKQMESDGAALVDVMLNLGSYAKAAMVWGRKGETRTVSEIAAAYKAETATKLEAASKSSAQEIAPPKTESFESKITTLSKKMADVFGGFGGGLLKEFRAEEEKVHAAIAKTSTELQHHGDYAANAAVAAERLRHQTEDLSTEQGKLFERLNPANAALKEYRKTIESINAMAGKKDADGHVVGADRIAAMTRQAQLEALPKVNPAADEIRKLTESVSIKSQFAGDKDAIDAETKVLDLRNKMLAAGVELTGKQEAAYRALLSASKDLEKGGSNGFTQWANSVKSETESMNDNIKTTMGSISDGLSKLVTEGRGKFRNLGEAVRDTFRSILSGMAQRFIKAGIDNLMKQAVTGMSGMFGSDSSIAKALGLGKSTTDDAVRALGGVADKAVASMNVTAANVVINSGIGSIGTSGASAFTANGPAGGSAMGGLSPQNLPAAINPSIGNIGSGGLSTFAGQPPASLMSSGGASLSQVMSAVKNGNIVLPPVSMGFGKAAPLGNIGGSGISAFGSGISPTRAPGEISLGFGRDGQSIGTIGSDGFAGYTKLVPIVPRSTGIGMLGGGSSVSAFGLQSPASILSTRAADDTMRAAGLQHLDFGKGGLAGREAYAWDFFKSRGYSDANTAKIMGNLKQEGAYNPLALNPNDGGPGVDSVGIAQWNNGRRNDLVGGRRALMERHAEGIYGKPYSQLTDAEKYQAQLSNVDRELRTPQYSRALSRPDAASFGKVYEGYGDNSGPTRNGYADGYLRRFGGRQPDMNPTGSIASPGNQLAEQIKPQMQKVGTDLAKSVESATKQATPAITQDLSKAFGSGNGTSGELSQYASKIAETGSAAQSAEGGLGGLIGKLGQLGGAGGGGMFGGGGGFGEMFAGAFSEGGYVDSPVSTASLPTSFWHGAPAFAEGGVTDGIPIIAHPAEAIIPLSRNRSIPVELRGEDRRGGGDMHVTHNTINLQAKDADSFRRTATQTAVAIQQFIGRAAARNS